MTFSHSPIPSLVLCLFSLTLSGQAQKRSAEIRQQAEDNALLIPEINNCCGIGDDFFLQINFGATEARWEACSPVVLEKLLFYPTDGDVNGSAEICVDLPVQNTTVGNFRIVDFGDFVENPNNTQQICATVNYPVTGFTDVDPGFVKKRFIAVPERGNPEANPTVAIQGSLTIDGNECQCDTPIQFGFTSVTSPTFPGAIGAYFLGDGENISNLKLTDVFGRVVYEVTNNPKVQITQQQIDVSPFKAGLYVVVLQLADGTSVSRKITIQ